jgi:hypothetical protein
MRQEHTLEWGALVPKKHGDDIGSWPRHARKAASGAIERGKAHVREKYGEFDECCRVTSCRPGRDGQHQLYICVTVRMREQAA